MAEQHPASRARARSRARRLALQALYQWQLSGDPVADIVKQFHENAGMGKADVEYFDELVTGCADRTEALEADVAPCLDRPLQQLDAIERAVLLIGAYEFSTRIDVPFRVVINEGVNLARDFGAEESHRYVNAVLDRLAVRLREVEYRAASRPGTSSGVAGNECD
ncbi:MAG: transcription antitermination factor NusB [Gammaproteobacteria bacterium]|jgi:N utilization substance protein B